MLAGNYLANVLVSGKAITFDGAGSTLTAPANLHALDVEGAARVRVVGLSIIDTNTDSAKGGAAVNCNGSSSLELDAVAIDAQQCGVFSVCTLKMSTSNVRVRTNATLNSAIVNSADATVDRSLFNGGDGVLSFGDVATTQVTNSVFVNMTGSEGAFAGVLGNPAGKMTVSFSTIINSNVFCGTSAPTCAGGGATGVGSCIDNSLFFDSSSGAPANTLGGVGCVANYSLLFPQSSAPSGANNTIGISPQLKDPANGDYHLTANSPAVDAADPAAIGTPDFDGMSRPQGTRSDMGAFELKQ